MVLLDKIKNNKNHTKLPNLKIRSWLKGQISLRIRHLSWIVKIFFFSQKKIEMAQMLYKKI